MRLKLYEDAIKAKAQKKKGRRNSRRSPTPQDEPTDADMEAEPPGEGTGGGDLASLAAAMSRGAEGVRGTQRRSLVLTQPGGLRQFVEKLRDVVFPRASEEARELFKVGQKPGSLARQNGESMLSYVSRRRRWWKLLKTLDGSIELSEPMGVELLLELSGLSRQEIIVIKACAPDANPSSL